MLHADIQKLSSSTLSSLVSPTWRLRPQTSHAPQPPRRRQPPPPPLPGRRRHLAGGLPLFDLGLRTPDKTSRLRPKPQRDMVPAPRTHTTTAVAAIAWNWLLAVCSRNHVSRPTTCILILVLLFGVFQQHHPIPTHTGECAHHGVSLIVCHYIPFPLRHWSARSTAALSFFVRQHIPFVPLRHPLVRCVQVPAPPRLPDVCKLPPPLSGLRPAPGLAQHLRHPVLRPARHTGGRSAPCTRDKHTCPLVASCSRRRWRR